MAKDPFYSARLKVERANQHVFELEREISSHLRLCTQPPIVEIDSDGRKVMKRVAFDALPKHVPTVTGDAIHNLRVSLDHAYWALVQRAGGKWDRNVKFPIFNDTREQLENTLAGYKDCIKPDASVIKVIINDLQPFRGGKLDLVELDGLDITDKHKLIVATVAVLPYESGFARVEGISHGDVVINTNQIIGGDGRKDASDLKPIFSVLFDEGPFEHRPVLDTLRLLSKNVSGALDALSVFL